MELLTEDIIVLTTAEGEDIEFIEIAGTTIDGKYYEILQPASPMDDVEDGEAFVFEIEQTEEGISGFTLITDDEIIDKVFNEYEEYLANL